MKKIILGIILVVVLVLGYFFGPTIVKKISAVISGKPPIVELFACSDYCPGPAERYTVSVYEGVTTQAECDKIGGKFSSYTGWTTHYICEVK